MMDIPTSAAVATLPELNATLQELRVFKVSSSSPKVQVLSRAAQYFQGRISIAKSSLIHRLTYGLLVLLLQS
jgi:hypothetical protein